MNPTTIEYIDAVDLKNQLSLIPKGTVVFLKKKNKKRDNKLYCLLPSQF